MVGARLTDETGDWEVVGFSDGRYVIARLDEFAAPEALRPGEIARRFNVEVADCDDSDTARREADAKGWEVLAESQIAARSARPAPARTPEEQFERLGHR